MFLSTEGFFMSVEYYDSPFHVTHDKKVATNKALKADVCIFISRFIKDKGWTQERAAEVLGTSQPRISDIKQLKIDNFTLDALFEYLDALNFNTTFSCVSVKKASISITKDSDSEAA